MTISYMYEIASSKSWSFIRIIFRWRGSIWKSVLTELFIWLMLYYIIFFFYRFMMSVSQQRFFAELAKYTYSVCFLFRCTLVVKFKAILQTTDYLPLTFMLGFFVKIVVDRWRDIFANIGFVDNAAFIVSNFIQGSDAATVMVRRNILRYLCLTQVLVLRDTSIKLKQVYFGEFVQNFPVNELIGFLQVHEREMMDKISNGYGKYWMPINWACALVVKMRESGKISSDPSMVAIMNTIFDFKLKLQVPVPIAYPQVVFLTIRVYFLICCISRQFVITETAKHRNAFDLYFPFMTVLQFIFYMLGEDDDDFEGNFILDRNLTIALYMADECYNQIPEQKPDGFDPRRGLLYSEASFLMPNQPLIGSAIRMKGLMPEHSNIPVRMVPLKYELRDSSPSAFFEKQNNRKYSRTPFTSNQVFQEVAAKSETKSTIKKDETYTNFDHLSELYITNLSVPTPDALSMPNSAHLKEV